MQEQYGLLFWMNELFPILSESHLSWDADLVAVEVVGLLAAFSVFVGPVAYLRQRSVAVLVGVDIDISAVPNESEFLFEAV